MITPWGTLAVRSRLASFGSVTAGRSGRKRTIGLPFRTMEPNWWASGNCRAAHRCACRGTRRPRLICSTSPVIRFGGSTAYRTATTQPNQVGERKTAAFHVLVMALDEKLSATAVTTATISYPERDGVQPPDGLLIFAQIDLTSNMRYELLEPLFDWPILPVERCRSPPGPPPRLDASTSVHH